MLQLLPSSTFKYRTPILYSTWTVEFFHIHTFHRFWMFPWHWQFLEINVSTKTFNFPCHFPYTFWNLSIPIVIAINFLTTPGCHFHLYTVTIYILITVMFVFPMFHQKDKKWKFIFKYIAKCYQTYSEENVSKLNK